MNKSYGLPYQGSKNKIAEWIVSHLPSANVCKEKIFVPKHQYKPKNKLVQQEINFYD